MNMPPLPNHGRSRGIAAVEFALVLPLLLMLLVFPLYFGRLFWHYAAIQKAAQNSARYLSTVPLHAMKSPTKISHVVQLTNTIVQQHLAELNPGAYPPSVTIQCDGITCNGFTAPANVRVVVVASVEDIFFPDVSGMTILLTADASSPYLGK